MMKGSVFFNIKGNRILVIFKAIDKIIEISDRGGLVKRNAYQVIVGITQIDMLALGFFPDRRHILYFHKQGIEEMLGLQFKTSFNNGKSYSLGERSDSLRNC